jgi:hypothetical protein
MSHRDILWAKMEMVKNQRSSGTISIIHKTIFPIVIHVPAGHFVGRNGDQ